MAGIGRTPNSVITFYNIPQLDTKAGKTLAFKTEADKNDYFRSFVVVQVADCTVVKKRFQTVRIKNKMKDVEFCNYLSFKNPDIDNRTYFCVIESVEYINEECTEITYLIDWWITDMHNVTFEPTFLQREGLSKEEYDNLSVNPYDTRYAEKMRSQEPLACNIATEKEGYIINDGPLSSSECDESEGALNIRSNVDGANLFTLNNNQYQLEKTLSCLMFTVPFTGSLDEAIFKLTGEELKDFEPYGNYGIFDANFQATHLFVDALNKIRLKSKRYVMYNNLTWGYSTSRGILYWDSTDETARLADLETVSILHPTDYYTKREAFYTAFPDLQPPDYDPYNYPSNLHFDVIVEGRNNGQEETVPNIYTDMEYVTTEYQNNLSSGYAKPYMMVICEDEYIKDLIDLLSKWGMTSSILGYYSIPEGMIEEIGADLYLGGQGTWSYGNSNFKNYDEILIPVPKYTGDWSPKLYHSPYSFVTLHANDGSVNVDYDYSRMSLEDNSWNEKSFKVGLVTEINPSGVYIGAGPKFYQNLYQNPNGAKANFENYAFYNNFPQVPYNTDAFVDFMATKARDVLGGNTALYKASNEHTVGMVNASNIMQAVGGVTSLLGGASGLMSSGNVQSQINDNVEWDKNQRSLEGRRQNRLNSVINDIHSGKIAGAAGLQGVATAASLAAAGMSAGVAEGNNKYAKALAEYNMKEIGGAARFFAGDTGSAFYNNYAGVAAAYSQPNYHPGSCGGVLNMIKKFRSIGLYFTRHRRSDAYMVAYDRFFKLFGYNTTQYKVPSIATFVGGHGTDDNSPHFEAVNGESVFYTQTERCKITGTTGESAQFIEMMMNGGMLFVDPTTSPTPPEPTTPEPTTPEPTTPEPTTPEPTTPEPTTPEPTPTPTGVEFTFVGISAGTGARASATVSFSVSGVDYSTDNYYTDNVYSFNPDTWFNGSYARPFYSYFNNECRASEYCSPTDTTYLKKRFRIEKDGESYMSEPFEINSPSITFDSPVVSTPSGAEANVKNVTVGNISCSGTVQFVGKPVGGSSYNQVFSPIDIVNGSVVSPNFDNTQIESVCFVVISGYKFKGSDEISLT